MPSSFLNLSLPKWCLKIPGLQNGAVSTHPQNDAVLDDESTNPTSLCSPTECYACTQVGVPAFHSTSCDRAHRPAWHASAGSSLFPAQTGNPRAKARPGPIFDPRADVVRKWNRAILVARGVALAVDPLFLYAVSVGVGGRACLSVDWRHTAAVTVIRTCVDGVHLVHVWLQFRLAYVSRESLVVGCGKLVWDPRAVAAHYVRSVKGFWFDVFVILPIPQVVFWWLVPKLVSEERIKLLFATLLATFMFQYLPKVLHSLSLMRRMQKVTGYVFGTIWWGFGLNLIAYFLASHAVGGCWYILAIHRVASCLKRQCDRAPKCEFSMSCARQACYELLPKKGRGSNSCSLDSTVTKKSLCLDVDGPFHFGIYDSALPVVSSKEIVIKIIYPITWGLFQLSSFGNNLEPTSHWLEVLFCIILVLGGLMLFTLLIGNIQVFLHAAMSNKRRMQLRCGDIEWWMKRRQLPSHLRHRVRLFETQRWITTGTVDEMELIKDLPEGLRRDIKRYLCIDLIKKVPLFDSLDDLILDNICDRVKPLVYSTNEKIMREGDPVQRMIFIVRGRIRSSQSLSKGSIATDILEPGDFLGDELLSWCLRRPFLHRLVASSATFVCIEPTEAFGLDAYDLRYITQHFRYKFANEKMKNILRYHSSIWRTWAAVNIQLAWRRHMKRMQGVTNHVTVHHGEIDDENWLRHLAAMFLSLKPHDHLE